MVEKDAPDLARLYFSDARRHRIDDGTVLLRAHYDCYEPGGVWRSQYEQQSADNFRTYRAIKIDIKAIGLLVAWRKLLKAPGGGCLFLRGGIRRNPSESWRDGWAKIKCALIDTHKQRGRQSLFFALHPITRPSAG